MASLTRARPERSQEQTVFSVLPHESKDLRTGPSFFAFPDNWWELGQKWSSEAQPVPVRDVGAIGGGLVCYSTVPAH